MWETWRPWDDLKVFDRSEWMREHRKVRESEEKRESERDHWSLRVTDGLGMGNGMSERSENGRQIVEEMSLIGVKWQVKNGQPLPIFATDSNFNTQ